MQIEDAFTIKSIGLVLAPSFELPPEGRWKDITEEVVIRTPEGAEFSTEARFSMEHMNIRDPSISVRNPWPVLVSLRNVSKECVPVGSKVYVSLSTKNALMGHNA